jgi:hypothetical protein
LTLHDNNLLDARERQHENQSMHVSPRRGILCAARMAISALIRAISDENRGMEPTAQRHRLKFIEWNQADIVQPCS